MLAKGGYRGDDQPRIFSQQIFWAQTKLFLEARAEVHQHHVGPGQNALDDRARGRIAKMQGKRVFAPVAGEKNAGFAWCKGIEPARWVPVRCLDLEHLGPAVGQHLSAKRYCDELSELGHPYAVERP